jgi:phosphotransferase system  glucose/maltose/N-acetylglucosamine-specific IIC component
MTPTTPKNTNLFNCIFVSLAIFTPILMVIVAAMVVTGHKFLAAILGLALVLRVVYELGFTHAHKRPAEGRRDSVIA